MRELNPRQTEAMSQYYKWHSPIYDATRWTFLFGRDAIIADLDLHSGDVVIEVGCGTGRNLAGLRKRIGAEGQVFGIDCAEPMLSRCRHLTERKRWDNIHFIQGEYGHAPVTLGQADAVLFSYSLSMIPAWQRVLACAFEDLRPGGKIGVVDFCLDRPNPLRNSFAFWMAQNHVHLDQPYRETLASAFRPVRSVTQKAFGGLWSFYRFVGVRP